MGWSLSLEPLLSPLWLGAVLVPVGLLVLAGLFLRRQGSILRLTAFAALAFALINPVLLDEQREPQKSVVALVIDRSQSQQIEARTEQTNSAIEAIRKNLSRFPQFELREVEAGQASAAEEQVDTRLFSAASQALRDVPPSRIAGTIMITDGQVHDLPKSDSMVGPLHALITGKEGEFDRRIRLERAPRFGIVGQPVELSYRVIDTRTGNNNVKPDAVSIRIFVNGDLVHVDEAVPGQETPFWLTVPNAGKNIVELVIDTEVGELTDTNNRTITTLDGIRESLRVLLVSGEPHAGERTWRNLLKSDTSVELVHFTILRPPEKQDGTPINELSLIAFPTRELFVEKIDDFDLIVFDRYQHRDVLPLLYYDYIAEYVENGGALLVAAGPEFAGPFSIARTPLIPALPGLPTGSVTEEGFHPRLTETGKTHPVTRGLEGSASEPPQWSRWFRLIDIDEPTGETVMNGPDDKPLLVLDRKGEGRVALLLSDQGWLWARNFEGGGPHAALYRRIAHWLMKEPELEEERLTATGRGMTLDITRQTMNEDPGHATIISPSGKASEVTLSATSPGIFTGSLHVEEMGLYQIGNGNLDTLAHVGPVNALEFQDVISTMQILQLVADASGGSVRRLGKEIRIPGIVPVNARGETDGRDWIGLRTTGDYVLKSLDRVPLFAGFFGLALLLFALGSMWYREGK